MDLFLLFFVICTILFITTVYWYIDIPKNLPPGPIGLPFIGSFLHLKCGSDEVVVLEKWAKKYGPLFKFYMGHKLIIVLANYEVIEQSLVKQGGIFSGRPIFNALYTQKFHGQRTGLLLTDGESWKEQRRFALSTLRDCGMGRSSLEQSVAETAEILVQELEQGAGQGPVDILDRFNKAVANVICSMAFGRTFEGEEFWRQLKLINFRVSESGVNFLSSVAYFPWIKKIPVIQHRYDNYFTALNTTLDFVQGLITEIIQKFDVQGSSAPVNYVDSFLKAQFNRVGKYFTNDEMLASVAQLFAAGTDTTSTTLRYGLYYLAKDQNIQEKLFNEISNKVGLTNCTLAWEDRLKLPYVEACLMEIQRMSNLLPLSFMHRTMAETTLMGYHIPADTLVVPFLWIILKDDKYFPDPDKFDPERFLTNEGSLKKHNAWIPFSAGKRICLGEQLARMELFIFLTALVMRFRFAFAEDQPCHKIERSLGFLSHPKNYKICITRRE